MKIHAILTALRGIGRAVALFTAIGGYAQQHSFNVKDCIAMTRFNEPSGLTNGERAQRSPDRRYFWLVTSRGLLDSNRIESTLWLVDAASVRRFVNSTLNDRAAAPIPRAVARLSAVPRIHVGDPYAPVISDVRWSSDSRSIFFLGQDSQGERQLYEANIRTRLLRPLSKPGYGVRQFDIAGGTIAYTAIKQGGGTFASTLSRTTRINADVFSVTGLPLGDILFPGTALVFGDGKAVPTLWVGEKGRFHQIIDPAHRDPVLDTEHSNNVLSLSPDGHLAVRLLPVQTADKSWSRYEPKTGFESWRINPVDPSFTDPSNVFRLKEFQLIDTATGKTKTLINGPSGDSLAESDRSQAVWSKTGARLLLTNVALPFDGVDTGEQTRRRHSCAVAAVDVLSLKAACIVFTRDADHPSPGNPKPERLEDASFGSDMNEAVLRFDWNGRWGKTERYRLENGQWQLNETVPESLSAGGPLHADDSSKGAAEKVSLEIRQGLNEPPKLWAVDFVSEASRLLWNPNPALDATNFGKARLYHWQDKNGYAWSGVLILPVNYLTGRQYPLVIQTHGIPSDVFITDGKYSTAMAARPLASAGIMVLQIPYRSDHIDTQQEPNDQIAGYEAAISQLDAEGLIDPNKVGIVGFSRTCWHVVEALIKDPNLFAAATIADGVDLSYMQYMLFGEAYPTWAKEFDKIIGAKPIGKGLSTWFEQSPTFHSDRIATPLRIEAIGPPSILMEWQIYRSLRLENKPVDMIYFPRGQHILQQPLDRLASEQGDVNWFRFWLQDYEDPDPGGKDQFVRWRHLRDLQNAEDKAATQPQVSASKPN
jgi:dipeptidyl aminopeptidase/acylaminoacyl peptidase